MTITPEIRASLDLGRDIAARLRPVRTLEEVAAELGISKQRASIIEQLALAKLYQRAIEFQNGTRKTEQTI